MEDTEMDLEKLCRLEQEDRLAYWGKTAERLFWYKKWDKVLDTSDAPIGKWFAGGEVNMCYNCVDRHVNEGHGEGVAIKYDSPVTGTRRDYTFTEMQQQVSKLGSVLTNMGIKKGDVVMIYMPMIVEGAFAMLACTRIGAFHACVPSGLPAKDLVSRIDHSKPKAILMATYGYHPGGWKNYKDEVDTACEEAQWKPEKILVYQRSIKDPVVLNPGRDLDWNEQMSMAQDTECIPMESNEPQFLIYTSGSTGAPKGVVHAVGPIAVRLVHDMPLCFGRGQDGAVSLATSNFGWGVGHSMVIYGPLLARIPAVLFEGDPLLTEDVRALYRLISENQVTTCFVRPGIFKLLKGKDPDGTVASEFDFSKLEHVLVAGERIDARAMDWITKIFRASVWNGWGQSETCTLVTGFPDRTLDKDTIVAKDYGPVVPGWEFHAYRQDGTEANHGELGRLLIRTPLPPGGFITLFGNHELCVNNYFTEFPGFYDTKDEGFVNEKGHMKVESRIDDIMKVGQVYLAAQAVEEVLLHHKGIADCVVVSTTDLVWKEIPLALYIKKSDCEQSEEDITKELTEMVLQKFGSSVKFAGAIRVHKLPLTRTGKVHRPSCNAMARGKSLQTISTGAVENPEVFEHIQKALKDANFGVNVLVE